MRRGFGTLTLLCMLALGLCLAGAAQAASRIKDIAGLQGVRENQLVGYGLVIGLQGTGDSVRNSPFTGQAMQSMLDRLGVNVRNNTLRTRNVAAVIVTADLPPFAGRGARIDVSVASMGDATSLLGGTLIATQLLASDGQTYAVAQGRLNVSGFSVQGEAERITQGVATAARIPGGAMVERQLPDQFANLQVLALELRNPDFVTAERVAGAINAYTRQHYRTSVAHAMDHRTISLTRPLAVSTTRFIAEIERLTLEPDAPARVVVDERTGTVVIGRDVKVSTVAVTHGNLTVRVTEQPGVSQPEPFSNGETVVVPQTTIQATQGTGRLAIISGVNLHTLVRGLNQIGLKPNGIIAILQAIKTAGALQADLVVQ
ncbi:MAG: flagellar biosynthesis protein FlgI [Chelatococcus sp.]|nr:MAG: flagellar biosynthesis protein FlgI [Chelatococcus sp.]